MPLSFPHLGPCPYHVQLAGGKGTFRDALATVPRPYTKEVRTYCNNFSIREGGGGSDRWVDNVTVLISEIAILLGIAVQYIIAISGP